MANVFPRARLRLIWIGWKSAARRGKPRQSMNHRAPGAVGISCFLTPSVRAVPYGPNASVATGGAALTSTRAHNQTQAGQQSLRQRVVVEHGIARLVRLGIRQSRYFGKTKTRFQVIMAAVVANLSLVVGFCHREQKPAMNTSDPEVQALLTRPYAPNDAQNGFLANLWTSWIRDPYFLLQHTLFGLLGNAASS